jgi:hypothetical protein
VNFFDRPSSKWMPAILSDTMYQLMRRLNHDRPTDWDVELINVGNNDSPERHTQLAALYAEFYNACRMLLNPAERDRLLRDIHTGGYTEPGPPFSGDEAFNHSNEE